MKKMSKLTKKLLLSALALGLAVVTLTTTTFAWYTSSTTASATGGSSTSGTTSDSTLLISKDYTGGDTGTWGKSVTFDNLSSSLVPVQWKGSNFVTLDDKATAATDYYQFTIYFKTTKTYDSSVQNIPVYLKTFKLTNTTPTLPSYDNLLGANNGVSGAPTEASYSVDTVRALDLLIDNGTKKAYDLTGTQTYQTGKEKGFTDISLADALGYYNASMGATEERPEEFDKLELVDFAVTTIDAASGAYQVKSVTFTIFLNGWDKYCFDACKGQDFTLEMSFSTSK